jgi:hypothetical protein
VIDAASMSGAMNALSFGEHVQGLMLWRAIGLGLAIVLVEKSSLTIVSVLLSRVLDWTGQAPPPARLYDPKKKGAPADGSIPRR